jgi:phosphoglycerate dehydrogenase-like enzyme
VRPVVWLPESTPTTELESLSSIAELRLYPAAGALPGDLPLEGDLLVASAGWARAIEVAGQLERLGAIQTITAGVDRMVDQVPPGVVLCDAAGVHDVPVAEWVVLAILAAQRNLPIYLDAQRAGEWRRERETGQDLVDAAVVLVGAGAIGRALEARLVPFGVRIERVARRPRPGVHPMTELHSLLPAADIVVILLPLTEATRGVIDAEAIAAMKTGALLVNAARGPIIDSDAMTAAVLAGRIRVVLDVTEPEPLPAGHPLWSAPGALITPHVASDVVREQERAWQLVREQVGRLARGEGLANIVVDGY